MDDFPSFMKAPANRVPTAEQNTDDVEGYFFEGSDGTQVAYWTCHSDRVSREHSHPFDEYMVCVCGRYVAHVDGKTFELGPGDELLIPKHSTQWGEVQAGTRSIHVFGGQRIKKTQQPSSELTSIPK